ncbi:tyrosine-type recombinase/integrase [Amycolatopsis keratiniphila]|uniref:Phage integrase n=1 Tax=Amycolatopsis keratiniphila TaxID=129921 RepID=R4TIT5_9PSEU|nr:tyrosine-type recombinase/integrase [Amycolatopsis keratiniphila]AGM10143.1 phage integrase [Amycolatopsis keratiniphila]
MAARRSRGDGGLHWDERRQRWISSVTIGYRPNGKRIVKKASGKTKTEAKDKLKEILRTLDEGIAANAPAGYTVAHAVNDWLANYELGERDPNTVKAVRSLVSNHIIPDLGARRLVDLSAEDVDRWLAAKAETLVTSTVRNLRSILRRVVSRAQARDRVKRNVVLLCDCPAGKGEGRPSNALTLAEAEAVLTAAEQSRMRAYIVLSLLTGARTEEMRALTWDHVDLTGAPEATPAIAPNVKVWRSVRARGETKTRKSRRSLALPTRAITALEAHRREQDAAKAAAGSLWRDLGLVFTTSVGTAQDVNNVRRDFRRVIKAAGLAPAKWTPRELRHSFVSILSDGGMPIEEISRLVGHSSTAVTELVYRKQIRPVVETGAVAMDRLLPGSGELDQSGDPAAQSLS